MRRIYLANGLFSEADRRYNDYLEECIRNHFQVEVYNPQNNQSINDKNRYADSLAIVKQDIDQLLHSDILIAVLDGQIVDVGVATELGYFASLGRPIIGLYTDVRQQGATNEQKLKAINTIGENQFHYVNLFTTGIIKWADGVIVSSVNELLEELACLN